VLRVHSDIWLPKANGAGNSCSGLVAVAVTVAGAIGESVAGDALTGIMPMGLMGVHRAHNVLETCDVP
jgi:hypothetical protein